MEGSLELSEGGWAGGLADGGYGTRERANEEPPWDPRPQFSISNMFWEEAEGQSSSLPGTGTLRDPEALLW